MRSIHFNPIALALYRNFIFFDDFADYGTAKYAATLTDTGTAALVDGIGGIVQLNPSDGTIADNDEAYLATTRECLLIANNKPLTVEARIQFTEAATNAANILFGVMDAVAANTLQDNGAGPDANFSGAIFYKIDGETTWRVCYSNGASQTIVPLTVANSRTKLLYTAGGSAYQTLRIDIYPISSTSCRVEFYIDGVLVYDIGEASYSAATEAQMVVGVKNGTAAQQPLNLDYWWAQQVRQ